MPPPAKYAGPVPNGMGQEPELSEWNKFLDREIEYVRNPPGTGGYLMYSGENIAAEDPKISYLHDWADTYQDTPAIAMWERYQQTNLDKKHVASYALSFAQARRAAQSKPELHMFFSTVKEPLMKDKSYWGAVEAGIITGPDSNVNKI
ncbi:hypothetical protein BU23DRAFT_639006 [Bimuria novae-zelandiae CBS 107.79]|uniref:Uncharacterized protein n=1 Tax=Bimuria novae-zelandiae CBS 107.79 TaxID=1447943 RepID=A0A6A5V9D1_9PLEO|nr:hypothetical protein BU23DRAFT_639006 [Bimuria novae-zelandiae CBS 107.79]